MFILFEAKQIAFCGNFTTSSKLKAGELNRKLRGIREQIQDQVNKLNRGLITEEQFDKKINKLNNLPTT